MESGNLQIGNISGVDGNVSIAGRDIVNNIKTIYQRALTIAEEAARARRLEIKLLAQGLSELARSLSIQASQGTESDNPYKGLLAYGLHEAEIFYGRNKARRDLIDHIRQSPLTVLHAESGAGKSSLLQAGIVPHLISREHLAIYLRMYHPDPVDVIKGIFLPDLTRTPALAKASLREFLRYIAAILGARVQLYLLLDQFEQFFRLPNEERHAFFEALADCLNDPSLRVKWVLALRGEALSQLAELEAFGIAPFKNTYRLSRLSRNEAREAMIEPARRHGIQFEQALTDHILDTLTTNGEVMPTHLQLVCSALSDDLPEDKLLTLAYYTEHEGDTQGILRDYLKRQLEHLPAAEQTLAWKVLRALITADRQRAVKTYDEIIRELKAGGMSKEQIDTILGRLVERRLLFTQPATIERFELAHDYLVQEIEIDPQEQARKAAQELLEQEVRAYQRHGTLLSAEQLGVIEPYRSELLLSSDASKLLDTSQQALQRERRSRERRRRWIVGGTVTALLTIIAILSAWLFDNRQQNFRIREQQLYSQSLLSQDSNLDINLLQWAEKIDELPEARFGLSSYVQKNYSPVRQRIWPEPPGWIFTMDISRDRNLLAAGRQNGVVNLWDVNTLQALPALQGPKGLVHYVQFSPDGDLLAASFSDPEASVYVWSLPDGKLLMKIATNARWVKSIAFSPTQSLMAISLDGYNEIRLCDLTQTDPAVPPCKQSLPLAGRAASIAFSPQGDLLAAGLMGVAKDTNTILLWDTATWTLGCELSESKSDIFSLDFDRTGRLLASGGRDTRISLWDPHACRSVAYLDGHTDAIQSVNFSPEGNVLASSSFDNTVRVWDVEQREEIGQPLKGHNFIVNDAVFGKDEQTLFSGSLDGSIIVWDRNQTNSISTEILNSGGYVDNISLGADGSVLAALTIDLATGVGKIHVWNTADYQPVDIPTLADRNVRKYALSKDGQLLGIINNGENKIQILQMDSGNERASYAVDPNFSVNSMAFDPTNRQLVAAGNFNRFISYNIQDGTTQEKDGVEGDRSIDMRVVAFSPDGKYMATGNTRGSITLRDAQTLDPLHTQFNVHQDWITDLAFSPKGDMLASTSYDGTILLWDTETLAQIGSPFVGHKSHVFSLAFSPTQPILISGGADKSIIWWSLENHVIIGKFSSEDSSSVTNVAVDTNNQFIVSSSGAGRVFVWRMDDGYLRNIACQIAERNLTQSEWRQYFPGEKYRSTCSNYPPGK